MSYYLYCVPYWHSPCLSFLTGVGKLAVNLQLDLWVIYICADTVRNLLSPHRYVQVQESTGGAVDEAYSPGPMPMDLRCAVSPSTQFLLPILLRSNDHRGVSMGVARLEYTHRRGETHHHKAPSAYI